MAVNYNPRIVTNGLVLCLDAANSKSYPGSGTAWADLSGNGYNSTLTNGPTFNSSNGGSITFDGVNDYALYNNNTVADNLSAMTVSIWVYANWPLSGGTGSFVSKITDAGDGAGWEMGSRYNSANNLKFYTQPAGGATWNYATCPSPPSGNSWINFVASYTGVTNPISLYLNGTKQTFSGSSGSFSSIATTSNISIASRDGKNTYGTKYTAITVGVVKIYNRQLLDQEVTQNFNALRGRFNL